MRRPDGTPKVMGNFAYASDLWSEDMLWGATVRSPYAHARLTRLDIAPALAMNGVRAVLTQDDVQGKPTFGQEEQDQPVFCDGTAQYWGEPVAVVAADDEETARRAAAAIIVDWEPLTPLTDPEQAVEDGLSFREMKIRRGDEDAAGTVVAEGIYETANPGPGTARTRSGFRHPGRRRWTRPVCDEPVDPRRPSTDRRVPRHGSRLRPLPPGRHRRCVRVTRGHLAAHPRRHAVARHRSAGQDGVRPNRVVRRTRQAASVAHVVSPRGRRGRDAGEGHRAAAARWRGIRPHEPSRARQRRLLHGWALSLRQRGG